MYKIKDKYHKLVINLNTWLTNTSNIYLDVYKQGSDVVNRTYSPSRKTNSDGSKLLTFTIPHSHWRVGNVLEKFIVRLEGSRNLYDLNEGITILVDGDESNVQKVSNGKVVKDKNNNPVLVNPVTSSQFALVFKDNEPHTIQAVYKGNNEIAFAASERLTITPKQPSPSSTPSPTSAGRYKLVQTVPKTMKYLETPNWRWRLTKDGAPVNNKTIEIITPKNIWTARTNPNGEVSGAGGTPDNWAAWTVGKYKVGAQFYHYDEKDPVDKTVLTECWSVLEIVKNTPKIWFWPAEHKGKTAKFRLLDPQNRALVNKTLTINVGSKAYVKTTDSFGQVYILINRTGNFNYKATYAGDENYNSVTITANETINS